MATPTTCLRCRGPIAVDSASGLCVTCFKALETERRTPRNDAATAHFQPEGETHSHQPDEATLSRPGDVDARPVSTLGLVEAATLAWESKTPQRTLPAGYEFVRYLGGGGMGDVFLARESAADRLVAMKFPRVAFDRQTASLFGIEIRALAKLDHANIVRILAVDVDRADPFFTMQYAAGGSLSDRIKAEGPMEPEEAVRTTLELARGLKCSHDYHVLHRDIKPGNVLFDADGRAKLGDFGLAKRMDEELATATATGRALGTPPFMPPEAVSRKHGDFGFATDIYSLGATLHYMLTGKAPFSGEPHEVMAKVVNEDPPRLRSLRPEIPMGLEAVVWKCLEKKPSRRYASVDEFTKDLEKCLQPGGQTAAPPLTRVRRFTRWVRRNRVWVAAGALAAILIAGLVAAWPAKATPAAADPAEEIRKELAAGRSVLLLGESGVPKYHRWVVGSAPFGAATNGSPACYYETMGLGLLELCPAPGIERYRIDLDILQLEAHFGLPPDKARQLRYLGPYFGHVLVTTPNDRPVHWLFGATYSDIRANAVTKDGASNIIRPVAAGISLAPERDANPHRSSLGKPLAFIGSTGTAGEWRSFRIDVAPEKIAIFWKAGEKADLEQVVELTPPAIQNKYAQPADGILLTEKTTVAAPPWSPDLPFGIWTQRTGVCIRNVRITPRPQPE